MSQPAPKVESLFVTPVKHGAAAAREVVKLVEDHGAEGDIHARPNNDRQLLIMDLETLNEIGLEPGALKENVTTSGIVMDDLAPGMRVRLGAAEVLITKSCTPCSFVDELRPGLKEALQGRRGMLARVVTSGEVRIGDAVVIS